jgi:hypothetical protein
MEAVLSARRSRRVSQMAKPKAKVAPTNAPATWITRLSQGNPPFTVVATAAIVGTVD